MNQSCASSRCDEHREAERPSTEERERYCEDDSNIDSESSEDEEYDGSGREKAHVTLQTEVKIKFVQLSRSLGIENGFTEKDVDFKSEPGQIGSRGATLFPVFPDRKVRDRSIGGHGWSYNVALEKLNEKLTEKLKEVEKDNAEKHEIKVIGQDIGEVEVEKSR
ncbi:uncharacterized protein J4E92_003154 [Alternaria infectoria]|uniref:uncharacterized protein n=1 Tax=Alternaria infectoria TaxID=45303 RepID=UPI00221ECC0D|nr:uncharacterized protein J4E92_003154 [Alternaria infectoria]KAI4933487.1 hypothetical protein J4E92_003154 [Alternaria infectoria]